MSNRKRNKTQKGRATEAASTTEHTDLAELLSAAMRHPDMPTDLHTYIADWLTGQPQERIDSPEYIRLALAHASGKGGAR